ncbi:MAG: hypothetical protein ACRDQY_00280, partial [Pseudonocardiaceae bacterium]
GRQEGARETVLRITRTMLVQRFGENPRIDAAAERLAGLPDEERLTSIATRRTRSHRGRSGLARWQPGLHRRMRPADPVRRIYRRT